MQTDERARVTTRAMQAQRVLLGWAWAAALLGLCAMLSAGCGRSTFESGEVGAPCTDDVGCGEGLVCEEGLCVVDGGGGTNNTTNNNVCPQGPRICLDAGTRGECGPTGYIPEACIGGSVCIDGACVPSGECEDGERVCDGNAVLFCEGGAWGERVACRDDQRCSGGICQRTNQRRPDLRVDSVVFFPEVITNQGDGFELYVDVSNVGDTEAGVFQCSVYAQDIFEGFSVEIHRFDVFGLFAGEVWFDGTFVVPFLNPSTYEIVAVCDEANVIDEIDEDNNFLAAPFLLEVISVGEEGADLSMEFAFAFDEQVPRGGELGFEYQGFNQGPQFVDGLFCDVYLEPGRLNLNRDTPIDSFEVFAQIGPFDAFNDVRFVRIPNRTEPGRYRPYLACYPLNTFDPFLDNNVIELQRVRVTDEMQQDPPNVFVSFVFAEPDAVSEGDAVELGVEVCNFGGGRVDDALVGFDIAGSFDQDDVIAEQVAIVSTGTLSPGQCGFYPSFWSPAQCFGQGPDRDLYFVARVVEVFSAVPEQELEDNVRIVDFPLTVFDCAGGMCEPDAYDFDDAIPVIPVGELLSLCLGDDDYFEWDLAEAELEAELTVRGLQPGEGLTVEIIGLRDGFLNSLFSERLTADSPSLRFERGFYEAVYVYIYTRDDTDIRSYTLDWEYTEDPPLPGDYVVEFVSFEGELVPGGVTALWANVINLGPGEVIAGIPIGVTLTDSAMRTFELSSFSAPGVPLGPGESIEALGGPLLPMELTPGPAQLRLEIDPEGLIEESNEDNNVTVVDVFIEGDPINACQNDDEPNNTFPQAFELELGATGRFELCQPEGNNDVDVFAVFLPEPGSLFVSIAADPGQGPGSFALTVYDEGQNFLTQAFAAEVNEEVPDLEPGIYYLRLVTSSNAEVYRYSISTSADGAP